MLGSSVSCALAALMLASTPFAQCAEWDAAFGSPLVGADSSVRAFAVFDDGTGPALYVGGNFLSAAGLPTPRIARWDGASWTALGAPGASINGDVRALAVFDDGTGPALYAGGSFTTVGAVSAAHVARWDGTTWSALGPPGGGTNGRVEALAVFDAGTGPELYAGGSFTTAGGAPALRLARWDGAGWSALGAPGSGTNSTVQSLAVFDDGSGPALYVGGTFTSAAGVSAQRIARWNGTSFSGLGTIGVVTSDVHALAVYDDGSGAALYAGGDFATAGGGAASNVAKWNGSSWSALAGGTNGPVYALAVYDGGSGPELCAGGRFFAAGGVVADVAKWNGSSWSAIGGGVTSLANPEVYGFAVFDEGTGPSLFAGGSFDVAGGTVVRNLGRWNGASWSGVGGGGGIDGYVHALEAFDDGSGSALYVGGWLQRAGDRTLEALARWDGSRWSPVVGSSGTGVHGRVNAFETFDDGSGFALYVGGNYSITDGVGTWMLARWNGTSWSSLGSGSALNGEVYALCAFDDGSGPALVVGGRFTSAGSVSARRIVEWNGSSFASIGAVGSLPDDVVLSLHSFDDGTGPALYVGGAFATAGGVPAQNLARWDGATWSALGTPGSGPDGIVRAIAHFDDGTGPALYVGGSFTTVGGVAASGIARWDGTTWSAVGAPGGGTDGAVNALTLFDDGTAAALYVAGTFTIAGGAPAPRIAKWDGNAWTTVGGGTDGPVVLALAAYDDGVDTDTDLYVGGYFLYAGGVQSSSLAEWHSCAGDPVPYCFGDGSGAACPCANVGLSGRGCDNSIGSGGARLEASGTTATDTLVLTQSGELASALSIFLQGDIELAAPALFGDGLRCIGGTLVRLYVKAASAGTVSAPLAGDPSIAVRSAALGDPILAGSTRHYQVHYRDPALGFCPAPPGNAFNVGNALRVTW